jgi:transposase
LKGERLVILNAGSRRGFIPNALLIFKSNQKTGYYYNEINGENYIRWLKEKVIPNLEPNSGLVIDNAPYHNIQKDKAPTSNSNKETMKNWFCVRNIPFCDNVSKEQLYEIIKAYKPKYKTFLVDEIMAANGHTVLRLPPYHPDLNPIELIWADVKQWVGANNTTERTDDVKRLCEQRFEETGEDKWISVCEHVDELEKQYCEREGIIEERIESIIITHNRKNSCGSTDSELDECESGISGVEELEDYQRYVV